MERREREIVLDTETTGLDPASGHCIVEIGCVELQNTVQTGRTYHAYINPMRDMPQAAFAVHGLSQEFLSDFPPFSDIVDDFLSFVEDAPLVIHNANFDMRFLSAELKRHGRADLNNPVVDTLKLAKAKYPGAPASLDMLCRRFKIDTSKRDKHGALLDAQLLSAVYLELLGGVQPKLVLSEHSTKHRVTKTSAQPRNPRVFDLTGKEHSEHEAILSKINASPWNKG
jgi:DNA polymerase-3 subunit epsilon